MAGIFLRSPLTRQWHARCLHGAMCDVSIPPHPPTHTHTHADPYTHAGTYTAPYTTLDSTASVTDRAPTYILQKYSMW